MQFFCFEMINFMIHHSQGGPENSNMIVFDKRFALFCLTLLNIQCSFFQSMSRLIQRLGHPWMKKHKPEIPQEDHWSRQTSSQKTVCMETHDITSISESNKDFLVAHAGVFHCCSILELVIILFFQVKAQSGWSHLSWRNFQIDFYYHFKIFQSSQLVSLTCVKPSDLTV